LLFVGVSGERRGALLANNSLCRKDPKDPKISVTSMTEGPALNAGPTKRKGGGGVHHK